MAAISREIVIDVPIERFFDLVIDYPRYPEFVPGIHGCRVKAAGAGGNGGDVIKVKLKTALHNRSPGISGGNGGDGGGANAGGSGGELRDVQLSFVDSDGSISLTGGDGGVSGSFDNGGSTGRPGLVSCGPRLTSCG